jgi:hypothetical protein
MPHIDGFMPAWKLRQIDRVAVAATPAEAWAAVRAVDLYRLDFVRWLFELRTIPERLVARLHGERLATARVSQIEDFTGPGAGFQILAEEPGVEVVVGAIGKFWRPAIEFAAVAPADFAAFAEPRFGKLAWCLRVDPRAGGGSWITIDLRVDGTDETARVRFERYWHLIGPFSHLIRRGMLRMFVRDLGAAMPDDDRALPGDELLARPRAAATDAIDIEAPVAQVWPWLVQMGCRRGGWYSYDALDNGGIPSAWRIIPELQGLAVGDLVPATPGDSGGFAVLRIDAPRTLVLGSPALAPGRPHPQQFGMLGQDYLATWAFVVEPIGPAATHLVVRVRGEHDPGVRAKVMSGALLAVHGAMEHAQLVNLKHRAEAFAS